METANKLTIEDDGQFLRADVAIYFREIGSGENDTNETIPSNRICVENSFDRNNRKLACDYRKET